jgi:hypothetical protein
MIATIKQCSRPGVWYEKRIGEDFTVTDKDEIFCTVDIETDVAGYILLEDAECRGALVTHGFGHNMRAHCYDAYGYPDGYMGDDSYDFYVPSSASQVLVPPHHKGGDDGPYGEYDSYMLEHFPEHYEHERDRRIRDMIQLEIQEEEEQLQRNRRPTRRKRGDNGQQFRRNGSRQRWRR